MDFPQIIPRDQLPTAEERLRWCVDGWQVCLSCRRKAAKHFDRHMFDDPSLPSPSAWVKEAEEQLEKALQEYAAYVGSHPDFLSHPEYPGYDEYLDLIRGYQPPPESTL